VGDFGDKSGSSGQIRARCRFAQDSGILALSQIILEFIVTYKNQGSNVVCSHQFDVHFDWLAMKTMGCSKLPSSSNEALSKLFNVKQCEDFWLLELEYSVSDLMSSDMDASANVGDHQDLYKAIHEHLFPVSLKGKLNKVGVYLHYPEPRPHIDAMWNDWRAGWQHNPEVRRKSSVDTLHPKGKSQSLSRSCPVSSLPC